MTETDTWRPEHRPRRPGGVQMKGKSFEAETERIRIDAARASDQRTE
jgi:hypothetical protein